MENDTFDEVQRDAIKILSLEEILSRMNKVFQQRKSLYEEEKYLADEIEQRLSKFGYRIVDCEKR